MLTLICTFPCRGPREGEAQEVANRQIRDFLSTGFASFDSQAFRVTRAEELMMGIADKSAWRCRCHGFDARNR